MAEEYKLSDRNLYCSKDQTWQSIGGFYRKVTKTDRSKRCLFLNLGLKISKLFGIVYLPEIRFAARNLICVRNNPAQTIHRASLHPSWTQNCTLNQAFGCRKPCKFFCMLQFPTHMKDRFCQHRSDL